MKRGPKPLASIDRFIRYVDKSPNGTGVSNGLGTDCWLWTGAIKENGYGAFSLVPRSAGSTSGYAHRFSFESWIRPLLPGEVVDHLCRNRRCVNPGHLEGVTQKENLLRGDSPNFKTSRLLVCKRGHAFEGKNIVVERDGRKRCRICKNERRRKNTSLPPLEMV